MILQKAAEAKLARVYPIGAVSQGQKGEELAEIAELKAAGCVAVTDDGLPVSTALLMRRALEYACMFDMPIIDHARTDAEGRRRHARGPSPRPRPARHSRRGRGDHAARDILLAEMTGAHVHIAHLTAWTTIEAVRQGKSRGVKVTCEVSPHHFTLTDDCWPRRRLRHEHQDEPAAARSARPPGDDRRNRRRHGRRDRDRSRAASLRREKRRVRSRPVRDHRPRNGVPGHARPAGAHRLDHAVENGGTAVGEPARILHIRRLAGGGRRGRHHDSRARSPVTVDKTKFVSKSKNTPFHGWSFKGGVAATIVGGRTVYTNPEAKLT